MAEKQRNVHKTASRFQLTQSERPKSVKQMLVHAGKDMGEGEHVLIHC